MTFPRLIRPTVVAVMLLGAPLMADETTRVLFDFPDADAVRAWQAVNDGVMGGVSDGRFKVTDRKTLEFFGTLSLENNGGFASVRSRPRPLGLQKGDTLVARVKGDGRVYSLNLYTNRPLMAFSYRSGVPTKKDDWVEVRLPLDKFEATQFGRSLPEVGPVNPADVTGLGFLLGDKKAGPFRLEVEWIKALPKKD